MREYMGIAFHRVPIGNHRKHPLNGLIHEMIGAPARWRLDHDFYSLPVELWLKNVANRYFQPPKSKVDAHQLATEAGLFLRPAAARRVLFFCRPIPQTVLGPPLR